MNSVFNSITSIVLVMHVVLNVVNSINNNNNNNDNNNNNNDNNNVFEYMNNFVNMNMNTAETMGGNAGRRKRRYLRSTIFDIYKLVTKSEKPRLTHFYAETFLK